MQVSDKTSVASEDSSGADGEKTCSAKSPVDLEEQPSAPTSEGETWLSGFKLYSIMAGITSISFLMLLDVSILSTAIPKITSQFHSLQSVGWYGAAYQLAAATLQPLTGKIYSNFNSKWTYLSFLLVFEIGSLLCGVAVSSNMLIIGRAVAGMGASGIINGALTIIAACAPMHQRPLLMGILMGGAQLGIVGGPLIGGVFTQFVSWRWCFYINLPLGGAAAALFVFLRIPEKISKPSPKAVLYDLHNKLDLVGFIIFAPASIMLLLAVQFGGNQYSWNSPVVIGLFCGAGVTFLLWLAWDYHKGDDAMIPISMLQRRYVAPSCLVTAFQASGMFLSSYYLPIYFQGVRDKSPAVSGVYLLPGILSQIFTSVASGKAVGRFGYYLPFAVFSAILTAIGYGLSTTLDPHTSTGEWIGYQILFGAGRGFGLQMPMVAVQNTLSPSQIPTAMGLVMWSQTFGGAIFLSFADTIFTNSLRSFLTRDAPGIDAQSVINAGPYALRGIVSQSALASVLEAYSQSVDNIFYLCLGLAGACFLLAWGMGFVDIRKTRSNAKAR